MQDCPSLAPRVVRTILWLTCGLMVIGVPLSFLHERLLFMGDSLTYIEGAHSLANGMGYVANGVPITIWPPGYSLSLSALVLAGMDSVIVFKSLNIVFSLMTVVLSAAVFRRMVGSTSAWLAAISSSLCFPWVYYTQAILAEMLFSAVSWFFVLSGTAFLVTLDRRWFWTATLGAMIAPVIRMAGVALWVPWLCVGVYASAIDFRGPGGAWRWLKLASMGTLVVLPLATFYLRNAVLSNQWTGYELGVSPEYTLSLNKIGITEFAPWTRLWINLRGYLHIFVVPDQVGIARIASLPWPVRAACGMLWLVIGVGWLRLASTIGGRFVITVALSYLALLCCNAWYDIRYLLPLLPLIVLGLSMGCGIFLWPIQWLCGRVPALQGWCHACALNTRVVLVLVAILLANLLFLVVSPQARKLRSREYSSEIQHLQAACRFLADRSENGSILMAGGGGFVRMWTGRKVVSVLSLVERQSGLLSSNLIPREVLFVLCDETEFSPYRRTYLDPIVHCCREVLTPVFTAGKTVVYRLSCQRLPDE